jgi:predicted metalloprotease with PDZ domain
LTKVVNGVAQTPGRKVQSVAQASFDAWIKYYRQDENSPNATVSYYTKGSLVALCLDLTLRHEGKTTLDTVMRALWSRCAGGPMTEQDLRDVLAQCSGRSFARISPVGFTALPNCRSRHYWNATACRCTKSRTR